MGVRVAVRVGAALPPSPPMLRVRPSRPSCVLFVQNPILRAESAVIHMRGMQHAQARD